MSEAPSAEVNEIVDLTNDGGVTKETITQTNEDAVTPNKGQEVVIHY